MFRRNSNFLKARSNRFETSDLQWAVDLADLAAADRAAAREAKAVKADRVVRVASEVRADKADLHRVDLEDRADLVAQADLADRTWTSRSRRS